MAKKVRLPFVVAHPVSFPTVDDLVPTLVLEREDFDPRVVEEAILADVLEIATTVVAESAVGVGQHPVVTVVSVEQLYFVISWEVFSSSSPFFGVEHVLVTMLLLLL